MGTAGVRRAPYPTPESATDCRGRECLEEKGQLLQAKSWDSSWQTRGELGSSRNSGPHLPFPYVRRAFPTPLAGDRGQNQAGDLSLSPAFSPLKVLPRPRVCGRRGGSAWAGGMKPWKWECMVLSLQPSGPSAHLVPRAPGVRGWVCQSPATGRGKPLLRGPLFQEEVSLTPYSPEQLAGGPLRGKACQLAALGGCSSPPSQDARSLGRISQL